MELFKGRPMAFIGTAALVCALLGWYLSGWAKLLVAAAVCLLFLLLICLLRTHLPQKFCHVNNCLPCLGMRAFARVFLF